MPSERRLAYNGGQFLLTPYALTVPMKSDAWAVLQLREGSHLATSVLDLEREFQARWPLGIFRFPAVKQGMIDLANPLAYYVFVQPPVNVGAFERCHLITAVLTDAARRPLLVTNAELCAMMPMPPFPPPGASVRVTAGDFEGLEGTVVEVTLTSCRVLVELWSRTSVLTLAANEFERL